MQATGIFIEHNANGTPTFARIDLNKYGSELKEFFSAKGISVEKSCYNPNFVKKIKSQEGLPSVKIKTEDLWK
ncbi:MAG: hypothetical protein FWD60_02910 [Candidatus Azobacteroides sp.]|nr:hypothetical protein [Candidatus Azobacteroides sp.]